MSLTTPSPASPNGHKHKPEGCRTYRGSSLTELIPQIREELGPDAIILREREGLIGGVNGFFAKRCVEVDARGAAPGIDVYDDDDEISETGAESVAEPLADTEDESEAGTNDELMPGVQPEHQAEPQPEHQAEPQPEHEAEPQPEHQTEHESQAQHEAEPQAEPQTETVSRDHQSFSDHLSAAEVEPEIESIESVAVEPPPAAATAVARRRARKSARRSRRPARGLADHHAKGPTQLDSSVAPAVARELIAQGISEPEAERLVREAAAHCSPFAPEGGLRDGVRRALASGTPPPKPLPAGGSAVAFVGAGGAGKTRCAAALAAAYARASTLSVTVISLGSPDGGRALKELLKPKRMQVKSAADAGKAERQTAGERSDAMIVVDTVAAAPGDRAAVLALSAELGSLDLDAIYVTVPATLGAQAARQLLEGLQPLRPNGIVITHADETDQIGVAVELAWASGIPVAYVHESLELAEALSAPNPVELARRLLP